MTIPTLKDQLRLRPGSRIVSMLIAIQHPDGSVVVFNPDDIRGQQIDIETNIDLNTMTATQTGLLSLTFNRAIITNVPIPPGATVDQVSITLPNFNTPPLITDPDATLDT